MGKIVRQGKYLCPAVCGSQTLSHEKKRWGVGERQMEMETEGGREREDQTNSVLKGLTAPPPPPRHPLKHSSNSLLFRKLFLQFGQADHTLLRACHFTVCVWSPTLDDMSQDGLGCK